MSMSTKQVKMTWSEEKPNEKGTQSTEEWKKYEAKIE